jgi:hypothetical protein
MGWDRQPVMAKDNENQCQYETPPGRYCYLLQKSPRIFGWPQKRPVPGQSCCGPSECCLRHSCCPHCSSGSTAQTIHWHAPLACVLLYKHNTQWISRFLANLPCVHTKPKQNNSITMLRPRLLLSCTLTLNFQWWFGACLNCLQEHPLHYQLPIALPIKKC